ncbi:MAG: serine hydrolase [Ramlibacter sp.]|nr:serine hydrolase [Ramlibacter sp.]
MSATGLDRQGPAQGLGGDRLDRLAQAFQSEIDRRRLPGATLLVGRRGQPDWVRSLGVQNPDTGVPMAPDSIFRIYSMTKPVVSVAVLMLMEQGKVLLREPVSRYLPEFADQQVSVDGPDGPVLVPVRRAATVQDLLRHTAGLTYEFLGNSPLHQQLGKVAAASRKQTNAEFIPELAAVPLLLQPGSAWEYSRATDVLGRLVEVVTGQTLGDWLQQNIFGPLGMTDTAFRLPAGKLDRVAEPFAHDPDGGVAMRVFSASSPSPLDMGGGGLFSTAPDYARFLRCLLGRGSVGDVRLLAPHTVDFMAADHLGPIPVNPGASRDLLGPGFGFGLGVAVRVHLGQSAEPGAVGLYYWGGLAGTAFFVDPANGLYAVLMVQAPNQREEYRALFRQMVYAAVLDA